MLFAVEGLVPGMLNSQIGRRPTPRPGALGLEQRHQPPLPERVAVDVALGDLYRLVTGEQLNVAQAAAGLMRVSRRRRNEGATP